MFKSAILILCAQAVFFHCVSSQACGVSCGGNIGTGLGWNSGLNGLNGLSGLNGGYGGAGEGVVEAIGIIPVGGSTLVSGIVPVYGNVEFGGNVPAGGSVSISGQCGCGCGCN